MGLTDPFMLVETELNPAGGLVVAGLDECHVLL
jgi:hypothetical protein